MIGIDIISITRIQSFIERFGESALKRFLSNEEIALCLLDKNKKTLTGFDIKNINITRIAGFWAAKEACAKALGVGIGKELKFLDIRINKNEKNAPYIELSNKKKDYFGINNIYLSISHDSGFAIAAVSLLPSK